ncbi:MAG: hypothetical protein O7G86_08760 [Gammaproteobacteria bacterium]|nr:hypothetical protein [Gammaproteobacteria bacterium]
MKPGSWGFWWGAGTGIVLALIALLITEPTSGSAYDSNRESLGSWLEANLGYSIWLFAIVFTLYVSNLHRLNKLVNAPSKLRDVVELDQLLDVWIHLFVGIGVIWTAVGMRSALQSALGDTGGALTDSASNVLRKLVDGGILLALTTTIVGGVGGYLMRLGKTVIVGASLQDFYEEKNHREMRELISAAERIEAHLDGIENEPWTGGTPNLGGSQ